MKYQIMICVPTFCFLDSRLARAPRRYWCIASRLWQQAFSVSVSLQLHMYDFFSLLKCIIVITLVLFYSFSDVHFLPNGYLNGKTVRVSFLGNSKFSFLDEDLLRTWYQKLYFENTQISPKAILDVGTGTGGSAFVLGELFPKANIMVSTYSIMFSILHYYIMLNTWFTI